LDHFGIPPERAVMVGDNYEADILGAHGTGLQAIWITRHVERPLPAPTQDAPEAVVQVLSEIPRLLQAV
jgi:FMN phosphatase YigB (HAD superfamily)